MPSAADWRYHTGTTTAPARSPPRPRYLAPCQERGPLDGARLCGRKLRPYSHAMNSVKLPPERESFAAGAAASGDLAYFPNKQGCSVTSHRIDADNGRRAPLQTISTPPAGFDARNTCSEIHLTPFGRFLYVGDRGQNSIAGFRVAPDTCVLMPAGGVATEASPNAFCLYPDGRVRFAGGTASGQLASYRIDGDSGAAAPRAVHKLGSHPAALAAIRLGN